MISISSAVFCLLILFAFAFYLIYLARGFWFIYISLMSRHSVSIPFLWIFGLKLLCLWVIISLCSRCSFCFFSFSLSSLENFTDSAWPFTDSLWNFTDLTSDVLDRSAVLRIGALKCVSFCLLELENRKYSLSSRYASITLLLLSRFFVSMVLTMSKFNSSKDTVVPALQSLCTFFPSLSQILLQDPLYRLDLDNYFDKLFGFLDWFGE